jgi:hypothetical protein
MEPSQNNSHSWKNLALVGGGSVILTMAISYFGFAYSAVKHEDFVLLRDSVKEVAQDLNDLRKELIPRDDLNRMRDQMITLQAAMNTLAQETLAQRREIDRMKDALLKILEKNG